MMTIPCQNFPSTTCCQIHTPLIGCPKSSQPVRGERRCSRASRRRLTNLVDTCVSWRSRRIYDVRFEERDMRDTGEVSGPVRRLYDDLRAGRVDRRTFVQRATALGVGVSVAGLMARHGAAQDASPSPATDDLFVSNGHRAEVGTENQERGAGGDLRIIQWQAPTLLSPHVSTGYKDYDAAQIVLEPLMHYLPDAVLYANLIQEVPSLENGLLSEDGTGVTLVLQEGLLWNDGEPVTAEGIKFTVEWVQDPENASTNKTTYDI